MKNTTFLRFLSVPFFVFALAGSNAFAEDFKIEFDWDPEMKNCFSKVSPEIKLFNVPEGTKTLKVSMRDRQSSYLHGGGKVTYSGEASIAAGALSSWEGPCPPLGQTHTYVFTVKTKGGEKAKARHSQKFKR